MKKTASKKAKRGKSAATADKPKRGKSAFEFFSIENRERIKNSNDRFVYGVRKALDLEWKELDAEKKEKYNKLAKEDKDRAQKENAAKASK